MKTNETYTLEQLTEMGLKEMTGGSFAGYRLFYKGDIRINRERYLIGLIKGNNGQEPKYKLIIKYKV